MITPPVESVMTRAVTVVSVDDTLEHAEKVLLLSKKRCVPVIDDDRNIFGVLSQRDILKIRESNQNIKTVLAWEACTHQVLSVEAGCELSEAVDVMLRHRVHHVLVLDKQKVAGILSVLDVVRGFIDYSPGSPHALHELI